MFKWGGWTVGGICAPVALLSGIFALYAIRHETGWRGRERVWIGIALALFVLVLVAIQMLRMRGLYSFTEGG